MAQEKRPSDESQSQQQDASSGSGGRTTPTVNVMATAWRGFGQLYDVQASTARMLLHFQSRAACAFGMPDYSGLFRPSDERARRVFSDSFEYLVSTAERMNEAFSDIPRQFGRLAESQRINAAESLRQGLEELGTQAEESLSQLKEFTLQQAEEAAQATAALGDTAREAMRSSGEEMRETTRQGLQRGQQISAEQTEALRKQGGREEEGEAEQERGVRRNRAA